MFLLPLILLGIEGFCPSEDYGGIHGFMELMKIISDPKHSEFESSLEGLYLMGWNPAKMTLKKLQDGLNKYKTAMWRRYMS